MSHEGRLYFIELDTLDRLEIQFIPDDITIARTPAISLLQVIGKNLGNLQYAGGETLMTLTLDFYAEEEHRRDVIRRCKWLESLQYNNGYESPPSKVKMIFGDLFRDDVWTVKSVVYKLSQFHKQKGYMPQQAYVDVILSLDPDYVIEGDDVKGSYAGNGRSVPRFV